MITRNYIAKALKDLDNKLYPQDLYIKDWRVVERRINNNVRREIEVKVSSISDSPDEIEGNESDFELSNLNVASSVDETINVINL
jgi:hypothetical protein